MGSFTRYNCDCIHTICGSKYPIFQSSTNEEKQKYICENTESNVAHQPQNNMFYAKLEFSKIH